MSTVLEGSASQGDLTGQKRNLQQVLVSNMRNQTQTVQSPLQDVGE